MRAAMLLLCAVCLLIASIEAKKEAEEETAFYDTRDCGKHFACWAFPDNCSGEECHAIVRWKLKKNKLRLQLQAKDLEDAADSGRYLALGFSEDRYMDNDTVVECTFDKNGKADAFISYNDHTTNVQLKDASEKMLKLKNSTVSDGRLQCTLDVDFGKHSKLQEGERETIIGHVKGAQWVLMFAQGLTDAETGEKQMHSFYPWTTDDSVVFCDDCEQKHQVLAQTSPHAPQRIRR